MLSAMDCIPIARFDEIGDHLGSHYMLEDMNFLQ
jgi:hypothetical protein